jgi:sulfur relay (sulfurtransferase) complex TusBCD TusD component (DsrE family)
MTTLSEKVQAARLEIRACVALAGDCDYGNRKCHENEKGILSVIDSLELKALVEVAEWALACMKDHDTSLKVALKAALRPFEEAMKELPNK